MAQKTNIPQAINENGTLQIFNNVILSLNGNTEVELNEYIKNIRYTTGTQTVHVGTLNIKARPYINSICSSPSGTITFVTAAYGQFYQFLNDRFSKFSLQFIQYTTGDPGGENRILLIDTAQIDDISGSMEESSGANLVTMGFKARDILWI